MKATHRLVGHVSWEESTLGHGGGSASEILAEFSSKAKAEAYLARHRDKLQLSWDRCAVETIKPVPFDPE